MRSRIISFIAIALFLSGFAPAVMAQSDSLRLVYYPPWNVSKLPMYLARETGVFERNGLKIIWTNPGSNEKLLDLMKRGEADIAVASANHVVQSNASGGATMILVGNTGYNYSAFLADDLDQNRRRTQREKNRHWRSRQHSRSTDPPRVAKTWHRSGRRT